MGSRTQSHKLVMDWDWGGIEGGILEVYEPGGVQAQTPCNKLTHSWLGEGGSWADGTLKMLGYAAELHYFSPIPHRSLASPKKA